MFKVYLTVGRRDTNHCAISGAEGVPSNAQLLLPIIR